MHFIKDNRHASQSQRAGLSGCKAEPYKQLSNPQASITSELRYISLI